MTGSGGTTPLTSSSSVGLTRCGTNGLAALLVDQGLDELDDPLLAGCCGVELPSHLGESAINLLETSINVATQVNEVLPESVETCCGGVSEVADLGSYLGDVAVGRAGQYPGCCGVLLSGSKTSIDLVHGRLQSVDPALEIILTHGVETTAVINDGLPLA